jgi:DNA-binding response OmpR family regulator
VKPHDQRPHPGAGPGAHPDLLLAEPDEALATDVAVRLGKAGVTVVVCHDGAEALLQVGVQHPGTVLLATPLPVVSAVAVTQLLAQLNPVPVIVGVDVEGAEEAMAALNAGAVACVARPYRTEEILPLLKARRQGVDGSAKRLIVGDIELDPAGFHVFVRGRALPRFPVREFLVLRYLMEHANQVVSRRELLREFWGVDSMETNSLTVHIRRIRNRLADPGSCCTIDAIRGVGYRLECSPTASQVVQPTEPSHAV